MTDSRVVDYLNQYMTERLPELKPGFFEDAPDIPSFTVDQRNQPLKSPWYTS